MGSMIRSKGKQRGNRKLFLQHTQRCERKREIDWYGAPTTKAQPNPLPPTFREFLVDNLGLIAVRN